LTNYLEFTSSNGAFHSSKLSNDESSLSIFEISHKKDGNVKGVFRGSVKAANGNVIEITQGKHNVKFSN
jgi:hypothetical protein